MGQQAGPLFFPFFFFNHKPADLFSLSPFAMMSCLDRHGPHSLPCCPFLPSLTLILSALPLSLQAQTACSGKVIYTLSGPLPFPSLSRKSLFVLSHSSHTS